MRDQLHPVIAGMSRRLVVLAGSIALGILVVHWSPPAWGFGLGEGVVLGTALFASALRRPLDPVEAALPQAWRPQARRLVPALIWRAAFFLLLAGSLAYVTFEVVPGIDVRRGFVLLAAWVMTQALL